MTRDEFEYLVKDYGQAVAHRETVLDLAERVERAEAILVGALQRVMDAWDALQADNARQANELTTLHSQVTNVLHYNSAPAILERDGVVRELREEIEAYKAALEKYANIENWRKDGNPPEWIGRGVARAVLAKFAKEQP